MCRIQAIKHLTTIITRQLGATGILFFGVAIVLLGLLSPPTHAQQIVGESVSDLVDTSYTGIRFNRRTGTFDTLGTFENISEVNIFTPFRLVLRGISPDTVTLANADGLTEGGEPYIDLPVSGDGVFSPGELSSNNLLKFNNPLRVRFTFDGDVTGVREVIDVGPLPEVSITFPADGLITNNANLDVSGDAGGGTTSVVVNGVNATLVSGSFVAENVPLAEGTNLIVATAQNNGGDSASDSITVRRDTDPPLVVIETPRDGDRLVSEMVTIAGTVNDIIPGATVNEDDVTVTVNGLPAAVNNRTFILPDLPLTQGTNTITAVAVDRVGNTSSTSITVSREPDLAGIRIEITEGNNQSGPINSILPDPFIVSLRGQDGSPIVGRPAEFIVSRGDGNMGDPNTRQTTVLTDAEGKAVVNFTLGSRTGEGFHRVRVTTPGSLTFAEFCVTATPAPPTNIAIAGTPPTRGVAGQPLSGPVAVIVTDGGGNPVPDQSVMFQVDLGGGTVGGQQSTTATANTNPDGIASVEYTLGPNDGIAINQVSATFDGNPGFPAVFIISGFSSGPIEDTTVSGIVQNSAGGPIVGARAIIRETALEALTGADGRFTIAEVPPGGHRVGILGSAANDPGNGIFFPDIDFAIEVVSGVDNELDQIAVLPFLDQGGGKLVGGNQDVILEMQGVQGFSIKVFANSVILPDGSRGEVLMSSSQVKFDKVPMPPPQGSTPLIVGTLQPAGIRFDPPAEVTYPNVEGLAPGDVADIFAFHHDIGQFVNVGPGTVSEDGSVVVSDPGFGIVQSGWHCLIRIPGPVAQCANGCQATVTSGGLQITSANPLFLGVGESKSVTVNFSPMGNIEGSWASANMAVATAAGGSSVVATLMGVMPGTSMITTPTSRIPLPPEQGGDKTCQANFDVTVAKAEIEPDDNQSGVTGDLVPSSQGANGKKHYVSPKGSGDVILKAVVTPNGVNFSDVFEWEGATPLAGSPEKAKVSRSASKRFSVKIKRKGTNIVVDEMIVWIVWANLNSSTSGNSTLFPGTALGIVSARNVSGYRAEARIEWTATITPVEIITDVDRPAIESQTRQGPPGGAEFNNAVPTGSSFKGWDVSRRIRDRWLFGNEQKSPPETLRMTMAGDPVDVGFMTPTDFPANNVLGNDDRGAGDEDDNPYDGTKGSLRSFDGPGFGRSDSRDYFNRAPGEDGDTLRTRQRFGEFVRVLLGTKWYLCSNFGVWRFDWAMGRQSGKWDKEPGQTEVFDLTDPNPLNF